MLALIALAFVVVPILEIYVIVQVGSAIGYGSTLLLVIAISVAGAWLTRHEGFATLDRIRSQLEQGRIPGNALIDGVLILGGGLLLLTPGFVTDGIGLLLLFPPSRSVVRAFLRRRFGLRVSYERLRGRRDDPRGDDVIDI